MSQLFKKLSISSRNNAAGNVSAPCHIECNYNNNYYGDQVCVAVKPAKPEVNRHLGIQV
ncbi:hypothetical protein D210916BOD24_27150 [Alteromonas sp. D210916BOD_24]|uniref:hypothetical protein n=1 Tax=Alteromonas sp. D210916BOD_24 TaxID=3157618 RepID=UPI00399C9211